MSEEATRMKSRALAAVLLLVLATACQTEGEIQIHPAWSPVEFSFNSRGGISVTRNKEFVTPLGTITVAAAATMPLTGPASQTLLAINHNVADESVQTRYRLDVRSKDTKVCIAGRAEVLPDPADNAVVVTAADGATKITVVARTALCPIPPSPPPRRRPGSAPPPTQRAAPRPSPSAAFNYVRFGKTRPDNAAPYYIKVTFFGLKGHSCLIKWRTYYTDTTPNTPADTYGSIRTPILSHDKEWRWYDRIMVERPSQSRRWGTVFRTYCRGKLLATGW
jgi:hypothetical protein